MKMSAKKVNILQVETDIRLIQNKLSHNKISGESFLINWRISVGRREREPRNSAEIYEIKKKEKEKGEIYEELPRTNFPDFSRIFLKSFLESGAPSSANPPKRCVLIFFEKIILKIAQPNPNIINFHLVLKFSLNVIKIILKFYNALISSKSQENAVTMNRKIA